MSRIRKTLLAVTSVVLLGGSGTAYAAVVCEGTVYEAETWSTMPPVDTWKVGDVLATMNARYTARFWITGATGGTYIATGFWQDDYSTDLAWNSKHEAVETNVPEIGVRLRSTWGGVLPRKVLWNPSTQLGRDDGSRQLSPVHTVNATPLAYFDHVQLVFELVLLKPLTNIPPTGLNVTTSKLPYRFESRHIYGALINNKECNVYRGTSLLGSGGAIPPIKPPPTPTCKLDTPRIGVALPAVSAGTLNAGEESMPGLKDFDIRLSDCSNNAKPIISLIDAQNTANTGTNLALKSTSTANGLALRIRNTTTNTDVTFGKNNTFSMGTPVGGTVVLPLQAYYVRTGGALRAGTVAADANFSVTFQ
ncbi:fimbrial protein [Burkholderia territorii]|uniref:fimbrial protein n=1 Tax=Burkholderia territorii TaxID=1503055 RepID=UPI0009BF549A|nr:fimbrial protein [Burkholderia territorii]